MPYQLANEIIASKSPTHKLLIDGPVYRGGYYGFKVPEWYKYAVSEKINS